MRKKTRIQEYLKNRMTGVAHATLNPNGPGVVRIHLIPPKTDVEGVNNIKEPPSVAIINGKDIIRVNIAWAIILNEFIYQLNEYAGKSNEVAKIDLEKIVEATVKEVKKVYPMVRKQRFKNDLIRIVNTLCDIAYGRTPTEEIGYMNIGQYAPFMKAPHRMDLMVSAMEKGGCWNCNQKCLHCYAAGQKQASVKELTTEEWKKVIDKCREIGIPQITFTGGEPTMNPSLVELVNYSQWFVTRLNTNGVLMTPELCKRLMEASLDSVQFTLYSYDPNKHNKLVGVSMHHKTVEGIKNALKAGLNVSINTPLCTINEDYVETLKFAHELGVMYVSCSGLIITGNARNDESKKTQLSKDKLYIILKEAKEFCDTHQMEISFTSPGWVDEEKLSELGIASPTCGACLSNMAVSPDGGVVPCQSWLSDKPIGNILNDQWEEIWNSMLCKGIRENSARMDYTCPLRTSNN